MSFVHPSIHQNEQKQFKWQGDRHGGDHHHTHGEQDVGDDDVDGDERKIDQEAYLEGLRQFGDGEGGDEDEEAVFIDDDRFVRIRLPEVFRRPHEEFHMAGAGVMSEEGFERFGGFEDDGAVGAFVLRFCVFCEGGLHVGPCPFHGGGHDVQGDDERHAVQDHVRGDGLDTHRVADQ